MSLSYVNQARLGAPAVLQPMCGAKAQQLYGRRHENLKSEPLRYRVGSILAMRCSSCTSTCTQRNIMWPSHKGMPSYTFHVHQLLQPQDLGQPLKADLT